MTWTATDRRNVSGSASMSGRLDLVKNSTVAFLFCGYFVLGIAMLIATAEYVGPYRQSYWILNYDLGFVRRALVGAVAELLFGHAARTERFIQIEAFYVSTLAIFLYCLLAAVATARHSSAESFGFVILGLLGGQMMAQIGFDPGNFDQFNFIAATLVLLLLLRSVHPLALLASGCLLALSVFVHEAVVVVHVPLLLVLAWVELRKRGGSWGRLLLLFLPTCAAAAIIFSLGSHSTAGDELCRYYAKIADFQLDCRVHVILTERFGETVANTLKTVGNPKYGYLGAALVMLIIFSAWQIVLASILRVRSLPTYRLALLAAASPMALCFVGIDYYRWLHLAMSNGLLLALFVATTSAEDPFQDAFRRSKRLITLSLFVVMVGSYVPGATVEKPHPPAGYLRIFRG
jgi:hypothetical protein